MKVSIVLPVYNVQDYLEKCVDSIRKQTYKDLEIILVNDGSTDNSGRICDELAKQDSRIRVIHQANGGVSVARNTGVKHATAEWLTFIDSDDYVTSDYIKYLLDLATEHQADISIGAYTYIIDSREKNRATGEVAVMTKERALERMLLDDGFDMGPWGKMYRTSLFEGIEYPVGKIYEDSATTYKLIDQATRVVYGSKSIYYYIHHATSIVNVTFNPKKMDMIDVTKEMYQFVVQNYPALTYAAKRRLLWAYFSTLNQVVMANDAKVIQQYAPELVAYINSQKAFFKTTKQIPKRDRIAFFILNNFGLNVYAKCWKIYLKLAK